MTSLVFIYNELLDMDKLNSMKVPMEFVSYAYIKAKLYKFRGKPIALKVNDVCRHWGNDKVYGAIFSVQIPEFYLRQLDAYHMCSLGRLRSNHKLDVTHREEVVATPITFKSLDDFAVGIYSKQPDIKVWTYLGNCQHEKLTQQVLGQTSRIKEGLDKKAFKRLTLITHKEGAR